MTGSIGSRLRRSWILVMIFSNACGVRCGSFPLDLLKAEFSRLGIESSSLTDPNELDNEGTSSF